MVPAAGLLVLSATWAAVPPIATASTAASFLGVLGLAAAVQWIKR